MLSELQKYTYAVHTHKDMCVSIIHGMSLFTVITSYTDSSNQQYQHFHLRHLEVRWTKRERTDKKLIFTLFWGRENKNKVKPVVKIYILNFPPPPPPPPKKKSFYLLFHSWSIVWKRCVLLHAQVNKLANFRVNLLSFVIDN